jgi:1-deoxy-D-xylulose-5-phosphate reductoisomerase
MAIAQTVDSVLNGLSNRTPSGLDDVIGADADARRAAATFIETLPTPSVERAF